VGGKQESRAQAQASRGLAQVFLKEEVINMVGRIIRNGNGGGYQFIELDDLEIGSVVDGLIERNLGIFKKCYLKTGEFMLVNGTRNIQKYQFKLALSLFELTALRSFDALLTELRRKIRVAKQNGEG